MSQEMIRLVMQATREKETKTREVLKKNQHAWAHGNSMFLDLPVLRAFWPMSSVQTATDVTDISGNENHLTNHDASDFAYTGLAPYVNFVSGPANPPQWLSKADGGAGRWADILGTEAYVLAAVQGLYMGGWFWFDDVTANASPIGKWDDNGVNQRSYMIFLRGADSVLEAHVSGLGTAASTVITTSIATSTGKWYFLMLNYDPSTKLALWVGDDTGLVEYTNTTSIPAAIFDSTAAFTIGRYLGGPNYSDGRASKCCLGAADLEAGGFIPALYHQTRAAYGV